jgi:hypothetical protein
MLLTGLLRNVQLADVEETRLCRLIDAEGG